MTTDINVSDDTECAKPRDRRTHRLSEMFSDVARNAEDHVTLGHIRDMMGHRAFAPLLTLFAAFNLMPLPPGTSLILGIPLLIIASQMAFGARKPWLPAFISRRSISATQYRTVTDWIVPRLMRVERLVRPRYWPFWRRRGERVVGVIALVLAIVITLPIPLGNWLPAFATAILGLALSERDGLLLAVGGAACVASAAVIAAVIGAAGFATHVAYGWMF